LKYKTSLSNIKQTNMPTVHGDAQFSKTGHSATFRGLVTAKQVRSTFTQIKHESDNIVGTTVSELVPEAGFAELRA